jgi:hypothetical protein
VDEAAGGWEKLTSDLINDEAITFEAKSFTDLTENKMNKHGNKEQVSNKLFFPAESSQGSNTAIRKILVGSAHVRQFSPQVLVERVFLILRQLLRIVMQYLMMNSL